jgi:FkbM family methyltransferase
MAVQKYLNIVLSYLYDVRLAFETDFTFYQKLHIVWVITSLHLKALFFKKSHVIHQKILGFTVHGHDYGSLLYLFREIFLLQEYRLKLPKENPLIIDCGANIGMTVLYFKFRYPDSRIMAFEPNPKVFEILSRNINENNLQSVEAFNVALSEEDGMVNFFQETRDGSMKSSLLRERGGENMISVRASKLSEYVRDINCDLIKIDVEGAEVMILQNLIDEDLLDHSQRYIIEYHHLVRDHKCDLSGFIRPFEDKFIYNISANYKKEGDFQDIILRFVKM